jgi:hypothetical protein
MAPIDEAIAFLRSLDQLPIAEVTRRFNVNRSTLSKRLQGKTGSLAKKAESNQLRDNKQELVLVEHIRRLSEWCLPPARELQDVKEAAKEQEALDEVLRAEARAAQKAQKELEDQQRRGEQVIRAETRKAEEALKKAQREKNREAKKAQKQLQTASKASQKRSRGRPPKQQDFKEPPTIVSGPINGVVLIPPKSRNGHTIKKSARFDGK